MSETNYSEKKQNIFSAFTNEEIFMVFHRFKQYQERLEKVAKDRGVPVEVSTPFGRAISLRPATPQEIEDFRNSDYCKTVNTIVSKLNDFAQLIKDVDPEMAQKIEDFK